MSERTKKDQADSGTVLSKDDVTYCHASFCEMVFYGRASWPSRSYWIVPGTITDEERV